MGSQDKFQHYKDSIERAIQTSLNSISLPTTTTINTNTATAGTNNQVYQVPTPGVTSSILPWTSYFGGANGIPQMAQFAVPPPPPPLQYGLSFNTAQALPSLPTTRMSYTWSSAGSTYQPAAPSVGSANTAVTTTGIKVPKVKKSRHTKTVVTASTYVPPTGTGTGDNTSEDQPTSSGTNHEVRASPPVPPNWQDSYDTAIAVIAPYTLSPVDPNSYEFKTLVGLMEPQLKVGKINRVINPELWKKFTQTRKDLMSQKVENLQILGQLGLPERELLHRLHVNTNFDKHKDLSSDYSDNVALLFHGTRGQLEPVLSQGLDERLGNISGGLLGRGIYFADSPMKSMNYDSHKTLIVFAVHLGDCLNVTSMANRSTFVREPAKTKEQQRNHTDLFFDSITGRPGSLVNEYVIYNRYQCCPLYTITYTTGSNNNFNSEIPEYSRWRNSSPPFAWVQGNGIAMPPKGPINWPFFAQNIFEKMAGDEVKAELEAPHNSIPNGNGNEVEVVLVEEEDEGKDESIAMKLSTLSYLGFDDDEKNLKLLKSFDYNVEQTIEALIQGFDDGGSQTATSSVTTNPNDTKRIKIETVTSLTATGPSATVTSATVTVPDVNGNEEEECTICSVAYLPGPSFWMELKCRHKLCVSCFARLETTGTTMGGVSSTFLKCPFCNSVTGTQIGNCPDGTMTVQKIKMTTQGNEPYSTYNIQYKVPGPNGVSRTAYIPASPEGKKVIELLKIAWDRRLVFVFGTSATTGAQNVLVWNIHHKTSLAGGVQSYGYPDPTYVQRVQEELESFGIK